jgi:hypothetical protein
VTGKPEVIPLCPESGVLGSNGTENSLKDSGDLDYRTGRAPERS